MSVKSYCVHSRRRVARDLGIAAVLLATIGLNPAAAAAADNDDVTSPTAEPRDAPEQQAAAMDRTVSELREGKEVRASHQETKGVSRAIPIETRSEKGQAVGTDDGQTVRTMSPDDPEWEQVHQGG